jgi:hypothetical protein
MTMIANAGLLSVSEEKNGRTVAYYPKDTTVPRNSHLNEARALLKGEEKDLRRQLRELPKKGAGEARQDLNSRLQSLTVFDFMSEEVRIQESQIRKWTSENDVEQKLAVKVKTTHRTLTGPYGDQIQHAIGGARGFPLADVVGAVNKLFSVIDLSPILVTKSAKSKAKKNRKGKRNKNPIPGFLSSSSQKGKPVD